MVRRRSAKPVTVVRFRYAPQEDRYCFSAGLLRFGNTHSGGGASTARNTRSSHVLADEITWEQYILKKCPCRPVERRFSETQCSQVGVFAVTWEQYVPDNRPYRPLQGRFRKTHRSQVFRPALSAFPPTTFVIVTNLKYRNHRDASEHNAERRLSQRVETVAGDETIPDCGT